MLFYILIWLALLVFASTREFIENQSSNHPYIMGFVKTSLLATSGELLASRILTGKYFNKKGLLYRFIIWGFLGMGFALMFSVYSKGVLASISQGLLPTINHALTQKVLTAFLTSLIMNLSFAPAFMLLHRVTDTYIDLGQGNLKKILNVPIKDVTQSIDWKNYFEFVLLKTIPIFWIPAHTITFLLPENYRVLMAGFLSIALGLILSFSKNVNKHT